MGGALNIARSIVDQSINRSTVVNSISARTASRHSAFARSAQADSMSSDSAPIGTASASAIRSQGPDTSGAGPASNEYSTVSREFADIFRQFSNSSQPVGLPAAEKQGAGLLQPELASAGRGLGVPVATPLMVRQPNKRGTLSESSGKATSGLLTSASLSGNPNLQTEKDQTGLPLFVPEDIAIPPDPWKPKLSDLVPMTEEPGVQPLARLSAMLQSQSQTVLTVAVRVDAPQPPAIAIEATTQNVAPIVGCGTQPIENSTGSGNSVDNGLTAAAASPPAMASAVDLPNVVRPGTFGTVAPSAAVSRFALTETAQRKPMTGGPDKDADTGNAVTSAPAFQDIQAKTEPERHAGNETLRSEPPRQAAPSEPPAAEKLPTQPLRSVSLEFTPDGARDVRVRLSERAGEVHVSLHSTDPSTIRSLRDGVTDLAGILASAGYDARAWTSGHRQRDNSQRPEVPPQRRNAKIGSGAESFVGVIRQSGILNQTQEVS